MKGADMKTAGATLILASLLAADVMAFDEPDEFMGVKWGTSCAEAIPVMEKRLTERAEEVIDGRRPTVLLPGVQRERGSWNGKDSCSYRGFTFRDLIGHSFVQARFHFLDGGFEAATLTFKAESYEE